MTLRFFMQAFFGEVTLPVNLSAFALTIVTDVVAEVAAFTSAAIIPTSNIPNTTTELRRFTDPPPLVPARLGRLRWARQPQFWGYSRDARRALRPASRRRLAAATSFPSGPFFFGPGVSRVAGRPSKRGSERKAARPC